MKILLKLLIVYLILTINIAEARPKIGLVLGGGGAAGVSHIGVLKVLEANHIPVDVVAGNSMGAIIGSLYASGMPVSEIEKVAKELDWFQLFQDDPNYQLKDFQQKQQASDFFSTTKLGVDKKGVKLSGGVVNGQRLMFELRRLLAPVGHINDFDKLPIPFRAVATDIRNGEAVVLKSGNLPMAVRASMSIPGIFAPVTINHRLLVDGLVSNNVPVDLARDMGADIVIVSRIPAGKPRELNSAIDITLQTIDLLMRKASESQLASLNPQDILIEPPIGDINSLDFARVKETIPLGEQGALAKLPELQALAQQVGVTNAPNLNKMQPPIDEVLAIHEVSISNDSVLNNSIVQRKLGIKAGQQVSHAQLQQALDRVYGLGYFRMVDYDLKPQTDGSYDLHVITQKSELGDQRLSLGFALGDDFDGDTRYQAGIKYTKRDLTDKGTELRVQGIIGERILAKGEIYHPLQDDKQRFVSPKVWYQERNAAVFDTDRQTAELRTHEIGAEVDVGQEIGNTAEAKIGVFYQRTRPTLKTGDFTIPDNSIHEAGVKVQYQADSLDSVDFPSKGGRASASLTQGVKAIGSDRNYTQIEVEGERVWSIKDKHRIIASGHAVAKNDNDNGLQYASNSTLQTGRLAFPSKDQWLGNYTAEGAVTYMRQIAEVPKVAKLHAGVAAGIGQQWQRKDDVNVGDLRKAGTVFIGGETPVGPAFVGVRKVEGMDKQFYFNLGKDF
jgi:NTE family protein